MIFAKPNIVILKKNQRTKHFAALAPFARDHHCAKHITRKQIARKIAAGGALILKSVCLQRAIHMRRPSAQKTVAW
jgi:hypothetical protein